jgi:serine/threonine-protein kinase
MARPPGDPAPAPAQDPDLVESDTVAFPLKPGGKGDSVHAVAPGTIVARKYRVERTIGRGGMGVVVEATHEGLGTRVAIKLLLPEFMGYTEAAERFTREARAVARLSSQHVARVIDVGSLDSGEPYMVMEYLDGEDLACRARERGPFAIDEAVDYIVQACDALAEAHARGIVHRDMKPANLFLTKQADGTPLVKLLDFGVSKILGEGTSEVSLTRTTMILGSALYMSPEQMRSSKAVDHRTDIYALGACLFEMLCGKPPYSADSFPELCARIYTSPPAPLRELRPEVPEGLVRVLEKSLEREPADRQQSVAELVQALAPYARPDTRAAIGSILRQHAPSLELPPPAPASTSRPARGADRRHAGARSRRAAGEVERPQGGRRALVLVGIAVAAAVVWGVVRFRPPAAEPALDGAAAASAAEAVAPASAVAPVDTADTRAGAAESASAAPDAADAGLSAGDGGAVADAGPADSGAAVIAAGTSLPGRGAGVEPGAGRLPHVSDQPGATRVGSGEPGWGQPGPAQIPNATEKTPPPPVNTDLVQETCIATRPDGTRKSVPCNDK